MSECVSVSEFILTIDLNSSLSLFSGGHATLHLAVSVGMSVGRPVGPSVGRSVTFLNSKRFLHYCSCPTVRDWTAVYPALFLIHQNLHCSFLFDTAGTTRTSSEANKTAARRDWDVTKRSSASKANHGLKRSWTKITGTRGTTRSKAQSTKWNN